MKPKIIAYNCLLPDDVSNLLQDFDVHFLDQGEDFSDPALSSLLAETEGIINSGLRVNEELLSRLPRLKIVSNISVGYDNLAVSELTKREVMATHTPDVLTDTVADAVFGLLVATARRMPELAAFAQNGLWTKDTGPDQFGLDVHHKVLGIIGMGKIGEAIAHRAKFGFHMDILYHNRSRKKAAEEKLEAAYCSLEELLKKSDFVCLMVPGNSGTEKIMGEKEFQLMKPTAIFINGSRGQNVDEAALVKALANKTIRAAGLDVLANEPPGPDNPLIGVPNAVIVPHIGSATYETELKMAQLAAENLISGLSGIKPKNLINQEIWDELSTET